AIGGGTPGPSPTRLGAPSGSSFVGASGLGLAVSVSVSVTRPVASRAAVTNRSMNQNVQERDRGRLPKVYRRGTERRYNQALDLSPDARTVVRLLFGGYVMAPGAYHNFTEGQMIGRAFGCVVVCGCLMAGASLQA